MTSLFKNCAKPEYQYHHIPFASVWKCWQWSLKYFDKRQKIRKYYTMCRGNELSERKTDIKPIVSLISFFPFFLSLLLLLFLLLLLSLLFIMLLFSVQADFQRKDATWLLRKATQKKHFAAAIIWLILLSYLTTTVARG